MINTPNMGPKKDEIQYDPILIQSFLADISHSDKLYPYNSGAEECMYRLGVFEFLTLDSPRGYWQAHRLF